MDISKILAELRQERDQIDESILSLERLAIKRRRRGRPPAWVRMHEQQLRDIASDRDSSCPNEGDEGVRAPVHPRRPTRSPMAAKAPLPE